MCDGGENKKQNWHIMMHDGFFPTCSYSMTEDLHELKVGMVYMWLDSLDKPSEVYKSEDEALIKSALNLSNSEPKDMLNMNNSYTTHDCERGHYFSSDKTMHDETMEGIEDSMNDQLENGAKLTELHQFGGLFDRVKEVVDLYTGDLAIESDLCSCDATLADAILHHFNGVSMATSREVDHIVDQVV